jgi:hypothetical protein
MADYYPLISRAVSGLSDQSPEMRGAVFERARSALLQQLRSLDPPLSEDEIDQERDALDAAIATIEAEYSGAAEEAPIDEPEPYAVPATEPERRPTEDTAYAQPDWQSARVQPHEEWGGSAQDGTSREQSWADSSSTQQDFPEPAYAQAPAGQQDDAVPESLPQGFRLPGQRQPSEPAQRRQAVSDRSAERARPRVDSVSPRVSTGGGIRAAIMALSLVVVIGGIASVAYWLSSGESDTPTPPPVVEAPPVGDDGKIVERIGGEPPATSPGREAAPVQQQASPITPPVTAPSDGDTLTVAQRAIFYEEDATNPQAEARASAGSAVWYLDPPAAGAVDPTIRSVVTFGDAAMTMTMTIRRNLDPTLPASHTIELFFVPAADTGRNVRDIGLLQLKEEETVRGAPVAGLPVPVQDNFFLIGLSNIPSDIQRNTNLLTGRNWIDIPIRFATGQRAIVSFEKGVSGEQIMARAFQAWNGEATAR